MDGQPTSLLERSVILLRISQQWTRKDGSISLIVNIFKQNFNFDYNLDFEYLSEYSILLK